MKKSLIYILLSSALLIFSGCSKTENTAGNSDDSVDSVMKPDTESFNAKIHLYNKDRQTAEINADRILKFQSIDSTIAFDLNVNIFDSTRHVTTEITGDSGIIHDNEHIIRIYGNVDLTTENGTRLQTDYLWWDYNTDRIKTDAFVKVTRGEDVITGWGMDADKKLNSIKILNKVSGEIKDVENIEP